MSRRSLAVVHNNIDDRSAIGAIAAWAVRAGLDRDWEVTVVCRDLDPELAAHVRWRRLYVPPFSHLLQWSVARPTVLSALDGWRPDAMLVYQPQLAACADVWHMEYLSRAARRSKGPRRPGLRGLSEDIQAGGVAVLEDRYIKAMPPTTRVLFCSEGLRAQFESLFAPLPNCGVLYKPALFERPESSLVLPECERRAMLTHGHDGPVLGFLGGSDPRKGGDLLVEAVADDPSLFLLHAGPRALDDSRIASRARAMGHLADVTALLDVIDVLVVPSRFEPFGLVVVEAIARGVPVLVGPGVGAGPLAVTEGVGEVWEPGTPIGPAVARMMRRRPTMHDAAARVIEKVDPKRLAGQLFADLNAAADRNRSAR
jgi:glycosyltransferase involved in cell wall biosynthesis